MSTMTSRSACGIVSLAGGHLGQRTRRARQQGAQRVLRLAHADLERGDRRQRREVLRLGLLHVELRVVARLEQPLRDVEVALLERRILGGDAKPHLDGTDRDVQRGHLRGHQHLDVVVEGDAGPVAGIGGLDAALELAPEIELPAGAQPGVERYRRGVRPALPVLARPEHLSRRLLHLRIQRAAGDAELRARLHDPQAGRAHVGIDTQRLVHQSIEHGIVEATPPLDRLLAAARAGRGRQGLERAAGPGVQPGDLGSLEVRSERRACAEQRRPGHCSPPAPPSESPASRATSPQPGIRSPPPRRRGCPPPTT